MSPNEILSAVASASSSSSPSPPSPENLVSALHHLSTKGVSLSDPRVAQLASKISSAAATSLNARQISQTYGALGRLGLRSVPVLNALSQAALPLASDFSPQGISTTFNACARMKHSDGPLLSALSLSAVPLLPSFNPLDLSSLLNALTRLSSVRGDSPYVASPSFVSALCLAATLRAKDFSAQSLANAFNALAHFGGDVADREDTLLFKLCEASIPIADDFTPQGLSNVLHSLAKQRSRLMLEDSKAAKSKDGDAKQQLAMTLLFKICESSKRRINEFNAQELATTLNSLSRINPTTSIDAVLCAQLCDRLAHRATDLKGYEISVLLSSLSYAGYYDVRLVTALCKVLLPAVPSLGEQAVALALHSLSTYVHYDEALMTALCGQARKLNFKTQGAANSLFALAVFRDFKGSEADETFKHLIEGIRKTTPETKWSKIEVMQINLMKEAVKVDRPGIDVSLPPYLALLCKNGHDEERLRRSSKVSKLRMEVVSTLHSMSVPYDVDAVVGGVAVDVLLLAGARAGGPNRKTPTAIIVARRKHFLRDRMGITKKMDGLVTLKSRIVTGGGNFAVHVPYYQWEELDTAMEREVYLRNKLFLV